MKPLDEAFAHPREVCPDLPFQWFDHIRKGTPLTFVKEGQIGYIALYENKWHFSPKLENGAVAHTFYLNQRTLGTQSGAAEEITYVYDPKTPANFPGGLCLNFGGMQIQPRPDFRTDVISFLSAPAPAALDVRGRMKAKLVCKSDCEDTCFYFRVSLVKGGVAFPLRDDITSLCYVTPDYTPGTEKAIEFTFPEHAFRVSVGDVCCGRMFRLLPAISSFRTRTVKDCSLCRSPAKWRITPLSAENPA